MNDDRSKKSHISPSADAEKTLSIAGLIERHLPWIQSYVHRKLGNFHRSKADTGDIIQDAMVQFLRHGPRIRLSNERQFRALLGRIVLNTICNKYDWFTTQRRAMNRERPLPADTVLILDPPRGFVESPSRIAQKNEEEAWVRFGLELLEPEERHVIILRDWEELSFGRIGKELDLPFSTARRRYMRSFKKLMEIIRALKEGKLDELLGKDLA